MIDKYRVVEIFDDNESGAVYNLKWLTEFKKELQNRKLIGEVMISSNARADNLNNEICTLLNDMGYRLLKVGLESGSNDTLKRLNKNENNRTNIKRYNERERSWTMHKNYYNDRLSLGDPR